MFKSGGDEVIIIEPCYVSYSPCVELSGGVVKKLFLSEKNKFKITSEDLKKCITDKTKILVINYPNNPTGAIMTEEDYKK